MRASPAPLKIPLRFIFSRRSVGWSLLVAIVPGRAIPGHPAPSRGTGEPGGPLIPGRVTDRPGQANI